MIIQIEPRADPGDHEKQHHEPGVHDVLKHVKILNFKICDLTANPRNPFCVIHVNHVVQNDDHNCDPFDVI